MHRAALLSTVAASLLACGSAEPRATLSPPPPPAITASVSETIGCRIEHEGPSEAPLRVRSVANGAAVDADGSRTLLLLSADRGHVAIEHARWVVEGVVRGDELPLWTKRPLLLAGALIPDRVRWSDARDGVVRIDAEVPEGVSLVRPLGRDVSCEALGLRRYDDDALEEIVGRAPSLGSGSMIHVRSPLSPVAMRDAEGEVVATLRGSGWDGWELGRRDGRVAVVLQTRPGLVWGEVDEAFVEPMTVDLGLRLEGSEGWVPVLRCDHEVDLFVGSERDPIGRLRVGAAFSAWSDEPESEWLDVEVSGLSAVEGSLFVRVADVSECF